VLSRTTNLTFSSINVSSLNLRFVTFSLQFFANFRWGTLGDNTSVKADHLLDIVKTVLASEMDHIDVGIVFAGDGQL
jgi:hypothetical protein